MAKGIKVIACRVMEKEISRVAGGEFDVSFIQYDYHDSPERLRNRIQEEIEHASGYQYVLLGFGLCGGATDGIQALTCPVIIPRVDDCIPLLLGSKEKYDQERKFEAGTYFLNQGWIEYGNDALKDYHKWREKYGERKACWLIKEVYKAYTRITLIKSDLDDNEQCLFYARKLADFLNIRLDVLPGDLGFIRHLFSLKYNNDFIKLEPGQRAERRMFRPNSIQHERTG